MNQKRSPCDHVSCFHSIRCTAGHVFHGCRETSCPRTGELSFTAHFNMMFIVNLEFTSKLFPIDISIYNCEDILDLINVLRPLGKEP